MRQLQSRQLFEYWNRIRDGRPAPRRDEIEPSDIRQLLADTFILEVSGSLRTISYRLAGTRLCAAFGRELKGYGFLGHWAEEDCFDIAMLLGKVYRDFHPVVFVMRGETASGKTVDYEMITLPLEPMPDGSIRLLGIATPEKLHYWLGMEPLINCTLRSKRIIEEIDISKSETPPLAPSLLPPKPGIKDREFSLDDDTAFDQGARRIAHLVVHEGGKS